MASPRTQPTRVNEDPVDVYFTERGRLYYVLDVVDGRILAENCSTLMQVWMEEGYKIKRKNLVIPKEVKK